MVTMYLICAVLGGVVMACQFVMTLLGLGDADDIDAPPADHDFGGSHGHSGGAHDHVQHHHHGPNWIFSVVTFRTVVAALAFFGMTGLTVNSINSSPAISLPAAAAAGVAAMYLVHWMMQTLNRLRADGTARIERSVGRIGEAYLRIPGSRSGAGKVTVVVQNRTMEYQALTSGETIPTGAKVVVIGVAGPDTVEVQLAPATEPATV